MGKTFKYFLAGLIGAILGGLLIAVITRAAPKIMMNMMARMREKMEEGGGFDMCREMMARMQSAPQEK